MQHAALLALAQPLDGSQSLSRRQHVRYLGGVQRLNLSAEFPLAVFKRSQRPLVLIRAPHEDAPGDLTVGPHVHQPAEP
ncbi:MAG: hypothetical protein MI919_10650, partial [Holophagales bacterium]|nr:hypothetical protein [Holophagales bacterium]